VMLSGMGRSGVLLGAFLFGIATIPIYSVAAAHAHDFAEDHERVELSAALMFLYAVGAIASPIFASTLIEYFGASAMFIFLALTHAALLAFSLIRMLARPSPRSKTPYVYTPRTSFISGRLFGRSRDAR
jgi:MFS family permease